MDQIDPLFDALRNNDLNGVTTWMESEAWQTLLQLLQIELPGLSSSMKQLTPTITNEQSSNWTCSECTFLNDNFNQTCDMCLLDRNASS
ncbi:unnamed protein product [Rotaria magnacalcarata]|uniref:RanBP2-type domain-containing protein n=1 Tax=Rotaria magnacalcarata TaxID=392030 RepID=A0A8S3EFC0_9BILA|nr:unnamed protein product [Rotaria magnacalcarata]